MNRAERRKNKIKSDKNPNISDKNIEKIMKNVRKDSINEAFLLMLGFSIRAFHDNFSDLWKKNVDGKSREERLFDYILDKYKDFEDGKITLSEVIDDVEQLTGNQIQLRVHSQI